MTLWNCCNGEIPNLVPGIRVAHCIDDELLKKQLTGFNVHRPLEIKTDTEVLRMP